ncbi:MAG: GNAT family N-acetyltransferase [Jhaorihella sp.]
MIVRRARPTDAGAIRDIWNPVIRDTTITFTTEEKSAEGIAADIAARGECFVVAEADGAVAGFATCFAFRSGPGYVRTREHSIQIAPSQRGRGLGRALMGRLESAAVAQDVHSLIAAISGSNAGAVAFHARIGFVEVGRIRQAGFKSGVWLDLVLMQKILAPGA